MIYGHDVLPIALAGPSKLYSYLATCSATRTKLVCIKPHTPKGVFLVQSDKVTPACGIVCLSEQCIYRCCIRRPQSPMSGSITFWPVTLKFPSTVTLLAIKNSGRIASTKHHPPIKTITGTQFHKYKWPTSSNPENAQTFILRSFKIVLLPDLKSESEQIVSMLFLTPLMRYSHPWPAHHHWEDIILLSTHWPQLIMAHNPLARQTVPD